MKVKKITSYEWLMAHVGHTSEACLPWPFARNNEGYGQLMHKGRAYKAHRFMCRMAHGEPPTPKHEAAHECGKGKYGCVNPRHLAWKTTSENQLDRRKTGTMLRNRYGSRTVQPPEQIAQIVALKGVMSQREIAKKFGISTGSVHYWQSEKARRYVDVPEIQDRIDAALAGSPTPIAKLADTLYPGLQQGAAIVTQWLKRRHFEVRDGIAYPRKTASAA